jgi:hypothetical protein
MLLPDVLNVKTLNGGDYGTEEYCVSNNRRFDAVEPLRTRVQVSYTPRSPCDYVHTKHCCHALPYMPF